MKLWLRRIQAGVQGVLDMGQNSQGEESIFKMCLLPGGGNVEKDILSKQDEHLGEESCAEFACSPSDPFGKKGEKGKGWSGS